MSHKGFCYKCQTSPQWVSLGGGIYRCGNCGFKRHVRADIKQTHHGEPLELVKGEYTKRRNQ